MNIAGTSGPDARSLRSRADKTPLPSPWGRPGPPTADGRRSRTANSF